MTKGDTNAGLSLRQSQLLNEQFTEFEDKLEQLLACYQFYDRALRAMTCPELTRESNASNWHLGLLLNQQWLSEQGDQLSSDLRVIKQSLKT